MELYEVLWYYIYVEQRIKAVYIMQIKEVIRKGMIRLKTNKSGKGRKYKFEL